MWDEDYLFEALRLKFDAPTKPFEYDLCNKDQLLDTKEFIRIIFLTNQVPMLVESVAFAVEMLNKSG